METMLGEFLRTVERRRGTTAVWTDKGSFTYDELKDYAMRAAFTLSGDGVGKGDVVTIELPRCREYFGFVFGAWMLGAAFVPSDNSYPEDRKSYIAENSGAKVRVDPGYLEKVGAGKMDSFVTEAEPSDIAFISYTSGSTGRPKGVVIPHIALNDSIERTRTLAGVTDEDRFAGPAAFTFIVGMTSALTCLTSGTPFYVVPDEARVNLVKLAELTAAHRITITFMAPAMVPYFRQKEKTIRMVVVGGERASNVFSDEFKVVNGYGSTETCGMVTAFDIDRPYMSTPLGRPFGNVHAYVLDGDGETDEGELCFTGNFSTGYKGLPEASAGTFVPNPFAESDGFPSMVRTGDIVRRLPDGNIVFLERNDWMVNINGQRVEPSEIAAVLLSMPQIVQAFVKDFQGPDGQTFLCAYYRLVAPVAESVIREHLRSKLPGYMVPSHMMRMETMPLNPSGKIDRNRLPDPTETEKPSGPADDGEHEDNLVVKGIRAELGSSTGRSDYGYEDNLIGCGMSSLSAIKFTSGIMDRFGVDLKVTEMLSGCSIKTIENEILKNLLERTSGRETPADKTVKEKYPLTASQLGVYTECYANPDSTTYNIPFSMSFPRSDDPGMDVKRVSDAVAKVIDAHYPLKCTVGPDTDGNVCMFPRMDAPVEVDVASMTEEEYAVARAGFVRPFDLSGSLYHAKVCETPDAFHVLLDFHHIMFDGSSVMVFRKDLSDAVHGKEVLPETWSMFDIAEDESSRVGTDEYKAAKEYYDSLLSGFESNTTVMGDTDDGKERKGSLKTVCKRLDRDAVKRFVDSQGVTENSFFQTAMGLALARYNYTDESCFATVHSGRDSGKTNRLVGMLVKTFPVACRFTSSDTPGDLVKKVHGQIVDSMRNDIYPFTEIASSNGITTEVMFAYQAIFDEELEKDQIEIPDIKNRIMVQVFPTSAGIVMETVYDASKYTEGFMECFSRSFTESARGLLGCRTVGEIRLYDEMQISMLDGFNMTDHPYDRDTTVVDMFRKEARDRPDHPAVVYHGRTRTMCEVDEVTDRVAAYVGSKGIGRDRFVGILTGRNDMGVIAAMGVAKSGAGYQPLDPSYPADRLGFMMEDSSMSLLIADRDLVEGSGEISALVSGFGGDVLYTDEMESLPAGKVPEAPRPDDAVIILYTSGTTGKPKGCVLEHAQAMAYIACTRDKLQLDRDSRIAEYASFGFDAGFGDIFTALSTGSTLYIIDDEIRMDIKAMERFYNDNGITNGFMTTQVGRLFMETARAPTLKVFQTGGEKLVPVTPPEGLVFYDMYGPSECLCYVASHRVVDDRPRQPIGTPNYNTRFYIVDRDMNRLPVGAMGELCISGAQVSRGYLNRPDKNAECFVENPFTDEPLYRRMYRTGDIARILPDGNLDFIGRNDGQVKIRGFRIELSEVEKTVRDYPGIKDATVQAYSAQGGGKFIAAFVVSDSKVDVEDLNRFIRESKPSYMVPAVTMQIEKIPLTVNSKVDKRRLPAPVMDMGEVRAPATDLQRRIFRIVSEVIGSSSFGTDTDLFQAGLTSIGGIRLNVLLSDEFGIPFQSRDVKDNPTVLKLESFIEGRRPEKEYPVQDDYPLTKTQEGIFVECFSREGPTTVYNVPLLIRIDDGIDIPRLKEAVVKAVDAHPYIMTSLFMDAEGNPRLRRTSPGMFTVDDIQEVHATSIDSVKGSLVEPFDLLGPRLLRVKLVHADGIYLMVEIHHIIGDGTSLNIFVDTVSRIYNGEEVAPERFSGFEMSLKEQEERQGEALEESRRYYDDLLSESDRDFLPKGDVYRPAPDAPHSLDMHGRPGLAEEARRYCEEHRTSMNGLVCSAFGYTLSRFNGNDHSVFTTVYNGRNDSRVAYSMSMFVKTLPVVCRLSDTEENPETLIRRTGEQIVGSMSHDIYSFSEISRELGVKADVMLVYQGDEFVFDSFCGRPSEVISIDLSEEKEPILFNVLKDGDGFRYMVDYDGTRFTPRFMEFLTRSFDNAIGQMLSCRTVGEISLTDDATMEVVEKVNDTDRDYDRSRTVVDDFVEIASRQPDHIAAVHEGERITYGEMDLVSDHIADFIRSKGIGRDEYVGILVPRGIHMVTVAEGVLKSGAAYQPLDPTYPEDRLMFMLKDSGVRLLIADRSLLGLVPGFEGDVLCIDEIPALCRKERPDVSMLRPRPEDAMIILYTSGTTGTPKGCVLEHRNIEAFLNWMRPETELGPGSRYASYASYGFDACMMDIHSSMTSGAELHIIPEDMRKDIAEIDRYFEINGITHGFMTTQMGRMFMESTKTRSLRKFMAGGEALVPLVPPEWVDFYNIYGPTECTVNVSTYIVKDDSPLLPIGRPNSNIRLYILDKNDRIVPVGACGELCISGPQVFREYLNNPEKTALTVVRNPYGDCPEHSRLYRTGDVVRLLPDGNFDYIGRRDGMVKVRGFRIELAEVEKVIRDHPAVTDATVKAFDDPAGGKSISAYIVSDKGVDIQDLKDFIKKTKPPYMVPAHFIMMDSIPVTANGKVDRRRLPAPSFESDRAGREPVGELETGLCGIFANVLGVKKVYADDDFFEIGGSSISASKLVMNCMKAGFPVVYKNIFDNPTPASLAAFIMSQKNTAAPVEETRETVDVGPLSSNNTAHLDGIRAGPLGDVLLTGATGFLGSHILRELLKADAGRIVCLVRGGRGQTAEDRLKTVCMYYFGGKVSEEDLSRIEVVDSDITDPGMEKKLEGVRFDTIINSAAVVKHFAVDDSIEKVNVDGVKNLISVAKSRGCMLVQVSTQSVAGESVNGSVPDNVILREDMLDIGQNLDNKYTGSKYRAEAAIIAEIPNGLRAKIVRVGNLMSRDSDGEFQINSKTNSFMKQLKAYTKVGYFPVDDLDTQVEFSPIDKVAESIVLLSRTPDEYTVFHSSNCHKVHMSNVLDVLRDNGMDVKVVDSKRFKEIFMGILADDSRNEEVSGLISYMGNAGESRRLIGVDETFTIKALYRLGFSWPLIDRNYIDKAVKSLKALRFFR
ncbi:MAG: amino acid adenylation domain-containing protein [archaeon]|nr:amino acid adenylation domain-containing protein [archaeon]